MTQLLSLLNRQTVVVDDKQTGVLGDTGLDLCNLVDFVLLGHKLHLLEFFPGTVRHKDVTGACPKRKPPPLHERRGREDISTRPPRLAGYPIKLAGNARLHRLSLAADSCVNRKYYGGDPGRRSTGARIRTQTLHTLPVRGAGLRFS